MFASNGISESSSGLLFRAVRVRTFGGALQFAESVPPLPRLPPPAAGRQCEKWAVTTTIFPPTPAVRQIAALPDWCVVVAADKKGEATYNVACLCTPRVRPPPSRSAHPACRSQVSNVVYLLPAEQEALPFATPRLLRWNHFGRKNAAFLYALQHGAQWVYDTDDDNVRRPAHPTAAVRPRRPRFRSARRNCMAPSPYLGRGAEWARSTPASSCTTCTRS